MSRLALEGVANAHRNRHVHVLVRQRIGRLFSLRAVVKRLKVIENRMWVRSCLLFWSSSFVFMSSHSHFSITLYPAFLKALVRSTVAVYNSSLVLPWAILVSPCRQNNGGICAPSNHDTGRLFPISWHTRQPVLSISISRNHSCTWRDEYVCPAACPFSQASLLLIEKIGSRYKTFSHTPAVEL